MVAKMRSVRALARMTKTEAKTLGLTKAYRSLFRVTDASSNLAPWVDDETEWMKLDEVQLGNGPGDGPEKWMLGDHIGVVVPWSTTSAGGGAVDVMAVLQAIAGEVIWREDPQTSRSGDWVGCAVATALNLDLTEPDDKVTVKRLLGKLLKEGVLHRVRQIDKSRHMRWYVTVKSVFD
jgi:hypothetical protein